MRILFNDEQIETLSENIEQLLLERELSGKPGIAVAVNDRVIPFAKWKEAALLENDNILVITAAAGG